MVSFIPQWIIDQFIGTVKWLILHRIDTRSENGVKEYIELDVPLKAVAHHLSHGDKIGGNCEPPACG